MDRTAKKMMLYALLTLGSFTTFLTAAATLVGSAYMNDNGLIGDNTWECVAGMFLIIGMTSFTVLLTAGWCFFEAILKEEGQ